jgi:hypothetical protein
VRNCIGRQGLRRQVKDEGAFPVQQDWQPPRESIPTNRATTIRGKPERQKVCWFRESFAMRQLTVVK